MRGTRCGDVGRIVQRTRTGSPLALGAAADDRPGGQEK
jgi:hypothetical protein